MGITGNRHLKCPHYSIENEQNNTVATSLSNQLRLLHVSALIAMQRSLIILHAVAKYIVRFLIIIRRGFVMKGLIPDLSLVAFTCVF